jgi:hypothetical protein
LEEIIVASVQETRNTAAWIRCADHVTPSNLQKLPRTLLTGSGRWVGLVRSQTKAKELKLKYCVLLSRWIQAEKSMATETSLIAAIISVRTMESHLAS